VIKLVSIEPNINLTKTQGDEDEEKTLRIVNSANHWRWFEDEVKLMLIFLCEIIFCQNPNHMIF
jgi:hypothetical protein